MKRYSLLGVAILIFVALVAGQAAAEPAFVEFSQTQYICTVDYSSAMIWESGNNTHGRGIAEEDYIVALSGPDLSGPNHITDVNWNINLKKGTGEVWGTFHHEVPALNGAWYGTWNGKMVPSGVIGPLGMELWLMEGRAVGYGVGDLEGKEVRVEIAQETYDPLVEGHPCDMVPPIPGMPVPMSWVRSYNTGYIIDHAGE